MHEKTSSKDLLQVLYQNENAAKELGEDCLPLLDSLRASGNLSMQDLNDVEDVEGVGDRPTTVGLGHTIAACITRLTHGAQEHDYKSYDFLKIGDEYLLPPSLVVVGGGGGGREHEDEQQQQLK